MDKEELKQIYASIHPLRMEGDPCTSSLNEPVTLFQSTPSAWRVTICQYRYTWYWVKFQSTPSAWRVTLEIIPYMVKHDISIHTLRMEGDVVVKRAVHAARISIHTLRMEGDHTARKMYAVDLMISIHTLRVEGDIPFGYKRGGDGNFNPHPPRGG